MALQVFTDHQGSSEWLESRRGVITGTRLKQVMGTPAARKWLMYELLGETISENIASEHYKSQTMEHGNNAEVVAKEMLSSKIGKEIVEVGLIKKYDWLGISCDGLIQEWEDFVEGVEIKSPESKNFVKYCIEWGVPDEYKWQIVHYFIVIDTLQAVNFTIFNENIKDANCRMKTWRITREEMQLYINQAKESLAKFKVEWDEAKKALISSFK